jgi:tetratricopeptide (TPR) repeat protein
MRPGFLRALTFGLLATLTVVTAVSASTPERAKEIAAAREALALREKELGPAHLDVARSLDTLSGLLQRAADYPAAWPLSERALKIREAALGPNHPDVAQSLVSLAGLFEAAGDFAAARPLYERALALREQSLGAAHPDVATSVAALAHLLMFSSDYPAARALYERALAIREKALGPEHVQVAASLTALAELRRREGDYAEARTLLERAVKIQEKVGNPNHPTTARTLHQLAIVLDALGEAQAAKPLYERALAIFERALGPNHPDVARSLNHLAEHLQANGYQAAARPLHERALRIREQVLGPQHRQTLHSLTNLADLLLTMGDRAAAKPLFERARAAAQNGNIPEMHWRAALGLGRILQAEGALTEALARYREAKNVLKSLVSQFREDAPRTSFLKAENRLAVWDAMASVLLALDEREPGRGHGEEAWAVLEARNGRSVAEMLATARPEPRDPQARASIERAHASEGRALALGRALRQEQARPPAGQQPERLQNLTELLARSKTEYLARVQEVLARYPQYKSQFVDQHAVNPRALAKFASRLPPDTVALQYLAVPDRLYLFIVAPGGRFAVKARAVTLAELYALVAEYRKPLERAPGTRLPWDDDGSPAYARDVVPFREAGRKLAEHLLAPIESELARARNVVLIPNDLLLYLPIHALTRRASDGAERFLAETHAVSYLTQLEFADLLRGGSPRGAAPLLAVANPDGTLPGAAQEVDALRQVVGSVTVLDGAAATKARFVSAAERFRVLHLATHGVFDRERPERSYLVMAGDDPASQRLSVREIAGMSLPAISLVILSACNTALGEQVPGAALTTLAAAFSQAGAASIVASLWRVDDASARDFMLAFHRGLSTTSRVDALQQAQLAILKNCRTAHPYYWAPFILMGGR